MEHSNWRICSGAGQFQERCWKYKRYLEIIWAWATFQISEIYSRSWANPGNRLIYNIPWMLLWPWQNPIFLKYLGNTRVFASILEISLELQHVLWLQSEWPSQTSSDNSVPKCSISIKSRYLHIFACQVQFRREIANCCCGCGQIDNLYNPTRYVENPDPAQNCAISIWPWWEANCPKSRNCKRMTNAQIFGWSEKLTE